MRREILPGNEGFPVLEWGTVVVGGLDSNKPLKVKSIRDVDVPSPAKNKEQTPEIA